MLRGSGFDVIDLGVDVAEDTFIDAVEESGAKVLGMSALLTTTLPNMGADGYGSDALSCVAVAKELITAA